MYSIFTKICITFSRTSFCLIEEKLGNSSINNLEKIHVALYLLCFLDVKRTIDCNYVEFIKSSSS